MLTFSHIVLQRGHKVLFQDATVSLFNKQKVGIVGKNGCGKSSLFALITGKLQVDSGEVFLQNQLKVSSLSQELPDSSQSALDYVLEGDQEYTYWQLQLNKSISENDEQAIMHSNEQLMQIDAYSKPALAASILAGLGFSQEQQARPVESFSGGWQMRLSLARCLMKPADLYLLDEPTNHLDLEAILWLEKWIVQLPAAVLLISHDREFLDNVVEKTLHIEQQNMKLYSGNYSYFEQARAQQLLLQQSMYEKQQRHIKHMMSFVERFKAKATKAKQAQSRMKAIERMDIIAQAHMDSEFQFEFFPVKSLGNPLIKVDHLDIGYSAEHTILKNVHFILHTQDRIGLLGPNGQGKSSFIKTLTGEISPLSGDIIANSQLRIGYYAQHQLDQLDLSLSPVETIQQLDKSVREQDIRNFFGGFNFCGDMATGSIKHFSGGEKARLALAKMVWQKPDVLLLDEPTNHLDLDIRASIEMALQAYEGAVILISHDRHLLKTTVNDFYLICDGHMTPFAGDLDDYYQWLLSFSSKSTDNKSENVSNRAKDYKETRLLQNKLKKLETDIEKVSSDIAKIDVELCSEYLYEESQKLKLQQLQQQHQSFKIRLQDMESEWLQIMTRLED